MSGETDPRDVSAILTAWGKGSQEAGNELVGIVYQELRRLAAHYLQNERTGHTLQPTALVNELYLKLFSSKPVHLNDREHFLAVASRQLRRIVVDHARSRHAEKRGGFEPAISLDGIQPLTIAADSRVLDLDQALARLELLDPRAAQVVELRFFGGLSDSEAGKALGISLATVKRDWDFARSWLLSQLA
jgi:RNA polymerase sigma factor (TIGR02999 family)